MFYSAEFWSAVGKRERREMQIFSHLYMSRYTRKLALFFFHFSTRMLGKVGKVLNYCFTLIFQLLILYFFPLGLD